MNQQVVAVSNSAKVVESITFTPTGNDSCSDDDEMDEENRALSSLLTPKDDAVNNSFYQCADSSSDDDGSDSMVLVKKRPQKSTKATKVKKAKQPREKKRRINESPPLICISDGDDSLCDVTTPVDGNGWQVDSDDNEAWITPHSSSEKKPKTRDWQMIQTFSDEEEFGRWRDLNAGCFIMQSWSSKVRGSNNKPVHIMYKCNSCVEGCDVQFSRNELVSC